MLKPVSVMLGTDPEFFLSKGGEIIGCERVIPKDGLRSRVHPNAFVVIDGVQAELRPPAAQNHRLLGRNISVAFELLARQMKRFDGVAVDWRRVHTMEWDELNSLSPETRILGSDPSKNVYGDRPMKIDASVYPVRSTGGHLHFGLTKVPYLFDNRTDIVPILDIFLGNTCVLLDRDPRAAERRENYGRAGEYREPVHGLEYRTLSSFWLTNYSLMSLVFGMAQFAVAVAYTPAAEAELVDQVNIGNFIKAIDTNDFDLAWTNLESVRPFLAKWLPERGFPLSPRTIDLFLKFADQARTEGLESWFPSDPVEAWISGEKVEFEQFLQSTY